MKSKILFVSRKWPPAVGGMETYSAELAQGLGEISELHTVVLPGKADGRPPSLLSYALFLLRSMIFCAFRASDYDRVIVGDLVLFPAAVMHRIRNPSAIRIVIVYGLDLVFQRRTGLLPALYRLYFAAFRAARSSFSSVVAISRYTAMLAAAEGLGTLPIVLPCLPRSGLTTATTTTRDLPAVWSSAGRSRRVLYFGRLVPRKGSLWFAQTVVPLLPPDCEFFVAGDSSDADYKNKLNDCPRTHCMGRVDAGALAVMITEADVVVMPNIPTEGVHDAEGFGLVAIETSALGGRLLASRMDGITDAVHDGVTGILIEPGDADAWASAVRSLLDSEGMNTLPDRETVARSTQQIFASKSQISAFSVLLGLGKESSHSTGVES